MADTSSDDDEERDERRWKETHGINWWVPANMMLIKRAPGEVLIMPLYGAQRRLEDKSLMATV